MTDIGARTLVGSWQLVRTESITENGETLPAPYGGDHAIGLVHLSADGRMVAVLCDSSESPMHGTEREFASYCGAYRIEKAQLITAVDASSIPAWLGTEQVRDISFDGDLMILRPPLRRYTGPREQRTLYWRKIA